MACNQIKVTGKAIAACSLEPSGAPVVVLTLPDVILSEATQTLARLSRIFIWFHNICTYTCEKVVWSKVLVLTVWLVLALLSNRSPRTSGNA